MIDETTKARTWSDTADRQAASLSAFQGPLVAAASHAFERYIEGIATLNQEMARFMTERLRSDADYGTALATCKSVAEATEMQQAWMRKATEDYVAEAQKLGEMGREMMSTGVKLGASG